MKTELLKHLKKFISFCTTEDNPTQKKLCLDWIEKTFLAKQKELIKRGEFNGAPYLYLPNKDSKLLLFAHIDVVPGNPDQFTLKLKGDKAYGRGVKDMKGAALAILMVYQKLVEQGSKPAVSLLFTSDEETAGPTIPYLLQKKTVKAPVAYTPDSSDAKTIITEHKGVVWAHLCAKGKGSHSALPWAGDNPIPHLAEAILKLKRAFPAGTSNKWQITVTPTGLNGGKANNQIPDSASCVLDIRYPAQICKNPSQALKKVKSKLSKNFELKEIVGAYPLQTDPNHPVIKKFKKITKQVLGKSIPIGREHGATDARFFSQSGIPAFIYGPIGGDIHGAEEWVSVKSLLEHIDINTRVLESLNSKNNSTR